MDDELSFTAQKLIHMYGDSRHISVQHDINTAPNIFLEDLERLQRESDYAAWTLVHGSTINHVALALSDLHCMPSPGAYDKSGRFLNLSQSNQFISKNLGLTISTSGGQVKSSADKLLHQSSIVADQISILLQSRKEDRVIPTLVSGGYVEFVDRYKEGFEADSAFHIFDSTKKTTHLDTDKR